MDSPSVVVLRRRGRGRSFHRRGPRGRPIHRGRETRAGIRNEIREADEEKISTEKGERSRFTHRGRFSVNIRDGIGGVGVAFAAQSAVVVERGVFERSAEDFTELASFGWKRRARE